MLVYIIKSAACLAILFVFYKLFLEKESVHKFKRFFLIGALLFSLIVPTLVFTEFVEAAPIEEVTYTTTQPIEVSQDVINVPQALEADVLDIEPILWGIYFLGLFFFGLKFIRNLLQIFLRIRKNPKHKLARFTQVLLQEKITPHTFFSYIFLNKSTFEANKIPKEVLLHEETHAQQKHSLDVIFIEFLQVIFWVNPFIYFTKKAIKLNHEFLADQAVLNKNIDETTYKNTLLSYLSHESEKKYQPLANAINYSSIKKRFTIMKTHTSKKAILFRSLLLLPLLAILVYGFSETSFKQREINSDATTIINDVNIEIDKNGGLLLNNQAIALADVALQARQLNASLEPYYFRNYVTANILYNENHVDLIELIEYELHEVGISNIEHTSKRTSSILNQKGFTPSLFNGKTIAEARTLRQEKVFETLDTQIDDETPLEIVWIEIKNENEIWFEEELIDLDELAKKVAATYETIASDKRLEVQIYATGILHSDFIDEITIEVRKVGAKRVKVMSEEYIMHENVYLDEIEITPETTILKTHKMTFTSSKDGASKNQIKEYNTLAKKYNTMLSKSKSVQIKKKDVDRLAYIYGLMSDKQKAKAEPFPEFPPLPESPIVLEGDKSNMPPPPKAPKVKKGEKSNIPPPPPPKAPKVNKQAEIDFPPTPYGLNYQKIDENATQEVIAHREIYAKLKRTDLFKNNTSYTLPADYPDFREIDKPLKSPRVLKGQISDIPLPPNPPTPKSPLDHVIEMAKKNAKFYLEGKEITSDKAIEIMKKNKNINIDSRGSTGKHPLVKMSTKPIQFN